ncbi:hypothetical protein [Spirosoma sp. KCTC 42546]|nr:hypothetical protein [Spirosoma sp. KCTC 42546]
MVTVNDEPGYLVGETYVIHVVFTYKLIPPEVEQLMETGEYFWHDD